MRLSDIEILGAIGDSDTAAFAARSTGIHTYYTGEIDENDDDESLIIDDDNIWSSRSTSEALTHAFFTLKAYITVSEALFRLVL